jgi:DNA-directed RNA polymerase specialized sigma54-like protein
MPSSEILSKYNLSILDLVKIFKDKIDVTVVNELYMYGCLGKFDKTIKKLLLHNLIFILCQDIIDSKCKEKIIIYLNKEAFLQQNMNLFEHYKGEDIFNEIDKILRHIKRVLPMRVFKSEISAKEFLDLLKERNGKGIDVLNKLRQCSNNKFSYSFNRAKSFCYKNGLVFLVEDYFERLKTKQLFIS